MATAAGCHPKAKPRVPSRASPDPLGVPFGIELNLSRKLQHLHKEKPDMLKHYSNWKTRLIWGGLALACGHVGSE